MKTLRCLLAILLSGCVDSYRGGYRNPNPKKTAMRLIFSQDDAKPLQNHWYLGNREFADNNGDGRIDWEVTSDGAWGTDGYGRVKRDVDFDGFYDEEREAGGIAGEIRWSRPIHEAVPPIHRGLIPGSLDDFKPSSGTRTTPR